MIGDEESGTHTLLEVYLSIYFICSLCSFLLVVCVCVCVCVCGCVGVWVGVLPVLGLASLRSARVAIRVQGSGLLFFLFLSFSSLVYTSIRIRRRERRISTAPLGLKSSRCHGRRHVTNEEKKKEKKK